jgi:hypothetical protein
MGWDVTDPEWLMAREMVLRDADSIDELLRLVREVVTSQEPRVFRDIVRLSPAVPPEPSIDRSASTSRRRQRHTTADDPLWSLIGLVDTGGPGDVARDVDRYLADGQDLHRR